MNFGEVLEEMKKGPEHVFRRPTWRRPDAAIRLHLGAFEMRDIEAQRSFLNRWFKIELSTTQILAEDWIRAE